MPHPALRRALGVAMTLTLAGCGSATGATTDPGLRPEIRNITVGVVASESAADIYVAEEHDLFRKAGLDVTLKTITGAAVVMPVLLHGGMQVVGAQYTTFIEAQAHGVGQFRILAPGGSLGPAVEEVVVPPNSRIVSAAKLKGATVAVNAIGGIDQILAEAALTDYEITPAQVHYVAIPFQGMNAALAAHRVDAAYLAEPYLTEAVQRFGVSPVLDPDSGAAQNLPIAGYVTTKSWAERYPGTAAAFARAIDQANALISGSREVLEKAMESSLGLTPVVADVMATGNFPTGVSPVQLQRVSSLLTEFGILKNPFSVKGMIG